MSKKLAWYAPGGALVTNTDCGEITGYALDEESQRYYGGRYLIAESMNTHTAKHLAESLGLQYGGEVSPNTLPDSREA